ncbi:putative neutral sphingomyelinase [Pocillopora verrucosa]|uniref:putative neutral sphingomyelinase n=1 Tax=Pocillopora verrucosa TaxID=203993 RepID=UPI00333F9E20
MADEEREPNLRVLTLNCWGIPHVSKMWEERKVLIAEELAKGHHDVVTLQEIWSRSDYELISQIVNEVLPYSHYFYSGVIGSGVCVFSRYPIIDAYFYRYSLNGYMYKITHADWFGGKGVGYCLIDHPKQLIHFFATHTHAEYNESGEYAPHRAVQAYQLSQFVHHLTKPSDAVLVCGDMNCEPSQLFYRIIKDVTGLIDAWDKHGTIKPGCYGNTSDVSSNTFSGDRSDATVSQEGGPEDGKRIDYIFYQSSQRSLECTHCEVTMGHVPGKTFSFSDHEGVAASFVVTDTMADETDSFQTAVSISSKGREALSETQKIIAGAIDALSRRQNLQVFLACALLLFAVYPVMFPAAEHSRFSLHHVFGKILYLIRIIGTFLASGFLFYGIFNVRDECSVYKAVQEMINVQLKKMCNRKRMKENSN